MNIKMIVGIGGFVAGVITGVLATKLYWKNKYEERYQQDKEILYGLNEKTDESMTESVRVNDLDDEPEHLSDEERAEIKKKLKMNYQKTTDYAAMYKQHKNDSVEAAVERDDSNDVSTEWTSEMIQAYYEKHKNDPPKIIEYDDIKELPPNIQQVPMSLYFYDNVLVSEEDNDEIDNPEEIIGDCLDNFYDSQDEQIIILNVSLDSVYIINKIIGSYYNPE